MLEAHVGELVSALAARILLLCVYNLQEAAGAAGLGSRQRLQILPHVDPLLLEHGQLLFKGAGKVVLGLDPLVLRRSVLVAASTGANGAEVFPPKRGEQLALSAGELGPCGRRSLLVLERGGLGAGSGGGTGEETGLDDDFGLASPGGCDALVGGIVVELRVNGPLVVGMKRLVLLAGREAREQRIGSVERVAHDRVLQLLLNKLFIGRLNCLLI